MDSANTIFANGLIEVSALATLIGAATVSSLALGNKAAAGLPWASISTFGAIQVAKASLSAAIPDWMREAAGLNGVEVENALGMLTTLKKNRRELSSTTADALAIQIAILAPLISTRKLLPQTTHDQSEENNSEVEIAYSLDATYQVVLREIPIADYPFLRVYCARPTDFDSGIDPLTTKMDWTVLLASSIKLIEVAVLWHLKARRLCWTSSIAWFVSFMGAIILQSLRLSRDNFKVSRSNILVGQMPSPLKIGGKGSVILQAPGNIRRHRVWRFVWLFNTIATVFSLLAVFTNLSRVPIRTVYIWLSFQALFMTARLFVHYYLPFTFSTGFVLHPQSWEKSNTDVKRQTLHLLMALAQYNGTIHPRGIERYKNFSTSFNHISKLFSSSGWNLTDILPHTHALNITQKTTTLDIIPDTVLSTISWAKGKQCFELYDAAITFIRGMAIPCIRVWTCSCGGFPEDGAMRGATHAFYCRKVKWNIWIPYRSQTGGQSDEYLSISTNDLGEIVGNTEVISHSNLHERLLRRFYNVSIRDGDEIRKVLTRAREAAVLMLQMYKEAHSHSP